MAEVLFVSKPVAPPWNDSSKNLVRDVAANLRRHSAILMGRIGQASPLSEGRMARVYPTGARAVFAPGLRNNLPVFRHLLFGAKADLWHFFFAPNARSCAAARLATAVRRVPSVHTICSLPADGVRLRGLLFADITVALSKFAHARFTDAGADPETLRLIPPCVPALARPDPGAREELRRKHRLESSQAVWIYPGDIEHGGGALVALQAFAAWNRVDSTLLMACRNKTPRAAAARVQLIERAKAWGIDARVRWIGETPFLHELLAASDFVVLPNRSPFAKMDYPLVALEAMCLGRPVLVGSGTPAAELAEDGGAVAVEPEGDALADAIEGLSTDRQALDDLQRRARALVVRRFSPRVVADAYERLYTELWTS